MASAEKAMDGANRENAGATFNLLTPPRGGALY